MRLRQGNKTVYILIGPKGSGKSYIGELIERTLDLRFLSVEPFFMKARGSREELDEAYFAEAWNLVEARVDEYLRQHERVMIESIGTFKSFKEFLARLEAKYQVKLVQVKVPLKLCMERICKRDAKKHVAMQPNIIKRVNKLALGEKHKFDISIENIKSNDEQIVATFKASWKRPKPHHFR